MAVNRARYTQYLVVLKEKKRITTQAARRSLHQFRKGDILAQSGCESPLPMEKITSGDLEGGRQPPAQDHLCA